MARASKGVFFAGVLTGAVVVPVFLFAAGWVVTSGASKAAIKESVDVALVENLTPICVTQFSQGAGRGQQLAELKSLSQWDRPDFVVKNGWATMPGDDSANSLVASECARRLAALE